jgi:hypothetical protein
MTSFIETGSETKIVNFTSIMAFNYITPETALTIEFSWKLKLIMELSAAA